MSFIYKRCYLLSPEAKNELSGGVFSLFSMPLNIKGIDLHRIEFASSICYVSFIDDLSFRENFEVVLVALNSNDELFGDAIRVGLRNVRVIFLDNSPFNVAQHLANPDADVLTSWLNNIHDPVVETSTITFPDNDYRLSYQSAFGQWISKKMSEGDDLFVPSRTFSRDEFDCVKEHGKPVLRLKSVPLAQLVYTEGAIEPQGGFLSMPTLDFEWEESVSDAGDSRGTTKDNVFPLSFRQNPANRVVVGMAAAGKDDNYTQSPPDLISEDGTFEVRFSYMDDEKGTSVALTSTDVALEGQMLVVHLLSATGEVVAEQQVTLKKPYDGSVLECTLWFDGVEPETPGLDINLKY